MSRFIAKILMVSIGVLGVVACSDDPLQPEQASLPVPSDDLGSNDVDDSPPSLQGGEFRPVDSPDRVVVDSDFELLDIASRAASPAVAIAPDTNTLAVFVGSEDGWPRVRLTNEGGEPDEVPDRSRWAPDGERAQGVSVAADRDSNFHLVFDVAGTILYSRVAAGTQQASRPVVVHESDARDSTIALSPAGEIVVAFIDESSGALDVMISRSELIDDVWQFGEPLSVNPGCCTDASGQDASRMSGPVLSMDSDGRAHVLYDWSVTSLDEDVASPAIIEYASVDGDGQISSPLRIAETSQPASPQMAINDRGVVNITYVDNPRLKVLHARVDDGEASNGGTLYEADQFIHLSLMEMDGSNQMHLAVKETIETGERLTYLAVGASATVKALDRTISEQPAAGSFTLTRRAGGMLLFDGRVYVPFERALDRDSGGLFELAVGR